MPLALPTIRPMTPTDVEPATAAVLRGEWGDRRTWFEFASSHPTCRPVVAEHDGKIVGTGVGTASGMVGWVGTIWVAEAHRGRGLGRALTEAVIDALEDVGCRTLLLVSTRAGRPIYERMGFELQTWYVTMEAPGTAGTEAARVDPRVRPFVTADLPAMAALDRIATGEDRRHLLKRFASPETARVLSGLDGDLEALLVRAPWGGGATIASGSDAAMRLLASRRAATDPAHRIRAGIPGLNPAGVERLERLGWTHAYEAPRMIRGALLEWRPEAIWGQFNMAVG
jgi:GNAT superfamily N-acetyltransferase